MVSASGFSRCVSALELTRCVPVLVKQASKVSASVFPRCVSALGLTGCVPALVSQARMASGLSRCVLALELTRCVLVLVKQARMVSASCLLSPSCSTGSLSLTCTSSSEAGPGGFSWSSEQA